MHEPYIFDIQLGCENASIKLVYLCSYNKRDTHWITGDLSIPTKKSCHDKKRRFKVRAFHQAALKKRAEAIDFLAP